MNWQLSVKVKERLQNYQKIFYQSEHLATAHIQGSPVEERPIRIVGTQGNHYTLVFPQGGGAISLGGNFFYRTLTRTPANIWSLASSMWAYLSPSSPLPPTLAK